LRWANSISTFFLCRREVTQASVLAMARALSRAASWIDRETLREGMFGQHVGFSGQASQSALLARYLRISLAQTRQKPTWPSLQNADIRVGGRTGLNDP